MTAELATGPGAVRGWALFETAIGACAVAWAEAGIRAARLPDTSSEALRRHLAQRFGGAAEREPPVAIALAIERVKALLAGGHDDLADIAIDLTGVPTFAQRVYVLTRAIPPGATSSYGEIATALGEPQAARAVGQALGANPVPIIVPCHRVLAARARAGGFSAPGGTRTKLRLLEIEGAALGGSPGLFDLR